MRRYAWFRLRRLHSIGGRSLRDLDRKDDRIEAAGAGAGFGAVAGGALGALTGLGLLAIPGVGPVVAAGWLVATLTGTAAGGAAGGANGGLMQAGVSKEEADVYAEGLRRGGTVVTARWAMPTARGYGQHCGADPGQSQSLSQGGLDEVRSERTRLHRHQPHRDVGERLIGREIASRALTIVQRSNHWVLRSLS